MTMKRFAGKPEREPATPEELREFRQRLSDRLFDALLDDFDKHGKDVIEAVRTKDAAAYLEVVAAALACQRAHVMEPHDQAVATEMPATVAFLRRAGRI